MEIGESCFWKNHGKLAHEKYIVPKIFPEVDWKGQNKYLEKLFRS
jgi:hypothetical protein